MRRLVARLLLPFAVLTPVATAAVQLIAPPAAHAYWDCTLEERGWDCYWH